jgi:hypothetical protein
MPVLRGAGPFSALLPRYGAGGVSSERVDGLFSWEDGAHGRHAVLADFLGEILAVGSFAFDCDIILSVGDVSIPVAYSHLQAGIAQLVEHRTCNAGVVSSTLTAGSSSPQTEAGFAPNKNA